MKYYFLFILTHIIVTSVKSQSDDRIVHWELAVPISYSLNERWKLNTTIANRNGFYENEDETGYAKLFSKLHRSHTIRHLSCWE